MIDSITNLESGNITSLGDRNITIIEVLYRYGSLQRWYGSLQR